MSFDPSWPTEAIDILERAIHRHGSRAAWERVGAMPFQFHELSGLVPMMKGYPHTFQLPEKFEVFPRARKVMFYDIPAPDCTGQYDNGKVTIISPQSSKPLATRNRSYYQGLNKLKFWRPEDAIYFFGYALTTYMSSPFIFPAMKFIRHTRLKQGQETWDGITLRFTDDFDAHCPVQTFYFDASGLLRRNDYHADIIGRWAMGAHYSHDYVEFKGIQVACRREVYLRMGTMSFPIKALHGRFSPSA